LTTVHGTAADRSVAPIAWAGALVTLAILVMLATAVWASYSQAVEESRTRASFIASTLERSVTRTLEAVELALVGLGDEARNAPSGSPALQARMADTLRFAPHIRQVVALNDGIIVANSRAGGAMGAPLDMARLDLTADGVSGGLSRGLRIGARVDGRFLPLLGGPPAAGSRSLLAVGVPVTGAAPHTAGQPVLSVVAALNPDYFAALVQDAGVGEHGDVSLLRFDGQPLTGLVTAPLPKGLGTSAGDHMLVDQRSALGVGSVVAYALSARYPAVVAVSLSHRDTFTRWLEANRLVLLGLGGVTLAVLAALALLAREALRRMGLQRQVRLLFSAVEQASAVVLITDAVRKIEYVNPEFTRLFGYDPTEAVGNNPSMLGSGQTPRATYDALWKTLEGEAAWRGEFVNRARDGTVRVMSASISRVQDSDGLTTHYIGVMDDITDRKVMEAERERMIAALSRSNAEMARLTEVMSHHFQEPVRRLATFGARLRLLAGPEMPDDGRMALSFIESESRRLRALVNDVQLYLAADIERPSAEDVQTEAGPVVAAEVARLGDVLKALGGRVEWGDLPAAPIDASRLRQVVAVLLRNALDHARAGVPPVIRITGEQCDGHVRYRVEDNGSGVPEAYRERVFRLFEKLKASGPGTGIGLAIARRIIEGRGGRIWIEDGSDGGAAILFDVPVEGSP
jgi:PAS domain S-box-containing protein